MDAAVAAAWAGVGIAFTAVGVSYYQARLNRRAIAVAERQAAVAEASLPPPPPPVGWKTQAVDREKCAMVNIGTEAAEHVEFDCTRCEGIVTAGIVTGGSIDLVRPGASIVLYTVRSAEQSDLREVWVRWRGQSEWIPVPLPPGWF